MRIAARRRQRRASSPDLLVWRYSRILKSLVHRFLISCLDPTCPDRRTTDKQSSRPSKVDGRLRDRAWSVDLGLDSLPSEEPSSFPERHPRAIAGALTDDLRDGAQAAKSADLSELAAPQDGRPKRDGDDHAGRSTTDDLLVSLSTLIQGRPGGRCETDIRSGTYPWTRVIDRRHRELDAVRVWH